MMNGQAENHKFLKLIDISESSANIETFKNLNKDV